MYERIVRIMDRLVEKKTRVRGWAHIQYYFNVMTSCIYTISYTGCFVQTLRTDQHDILYSVTHC